MKELLIARWDEHFPDDEDTGAHANMWMFDEFVMQVLACVVYQRGQLLSKPLKLLQEHDELKKVVDKQKCDGGETSDSDKSATDSAKTIGGEADEKGCTQKLPSGAERFTVVLPAAKRTFPHNYKKCLEQKTTFQNKKKEVNKLRKGYVALMDELQIEDTEEKQCLLKRQMKHVNGKIKEKSAEAAAAFKAGCEIAAVLNHKVKDKVKDQDTQMKVDVSLANALEKNVRKSIEIVEARKRLKLAMDSNLTFEETLGSDGEAYANYTTRLA